MANADIPWQIDHSVQCDLTRCNPSQLLFRGFSPETAGLRDVRNTSLYGFNQ